MNEARAPAHPGLHVEQLRVVSDHALPPAQAQSLAQGFAAELDAAVLQQRPGAGPLRIRELVVHADAGTLQDARALRALAQSAAARILDRVPE